MFVLVPYMSDMFQKPGMEHQQLARHFACLPSSLHPLIHRREEVSHLGTCFHQPQNSTVEGLFQDGDRKLVPGEAIRYRKQTHELPQVGHRLFVPHLVVLKKQTQLLLDGIAEAGTVDFE